MWIIEILNLLYRLLILALVLIVLHYCGPLLAVLLAILIKLAHLLGAGN